MIWMFDQAPDLACVTCRSVIEGAPVLIVTHYDDDHSWAFMDGQAHDLSEALLVAMSTVIDRHPDLQEIASLAPGWTATRGAANQPWIYHWDAWTPDEA